MVRIINYQIMPEYAYNKSVFSLKKKFQNHVRDFKIFLYCIFYLIF